MTTSPLNPQSVVPDRGIEDPSVEIAPEARLSHDGQRPSDNPEHFEAQLDDVFDLMISNNQRIKLLLNMDKNNQYETLKRLMDIYTISSVKKLEKFFIHLCRFDTEIDLYLKSEMLYLLSCTLRLWRHRDRPSPSYGRGCSKAQSIKEAFCNTLFLMLVKGLNSVESSNWLLFEENFKLYSSLFKDENNNILLKNIIILSFKRKHIPFKKIFNFIACDLDLCVFMFQKYKKKLEPKNNLLLLQLLFEKENQFAADLFHIINNNSLEINLRLEACDILLLKGSRTIQNMVQTMIENISPHLPYTNNPENVHLSSVNQSIDKTLNGLIESNKGKEPPVDLYDMLLSKFASNEKTKGSLNRIFNYSFLKFSKYKLTLKEIIENVWVFIENCEEELRSQLFGRLEQELVDMYDTCSQGYASRLINIFTGFQMTDLGIAISYEDEIYAIFSNKVNKLIIEAPQPIQETLLEELIVPTNDYENRLNLTSFLRPHLPKIWNEIFEIFKNELTTIDLDLYCRKVTMRYEGLS
jgi:hypothetical protein